MSDTEKLNEAADGGLLQPRLVRLSWRKEQARYGPETYRLRRGGKEELAVVQKNKAGSWFWYGGGRNTCAAPTDLATAKKDAKTHVLSLENAIGEARRDGTPPQQ